MAAISDLKVQTIIFGLASAALVGVQGWTLVTLVSMSNSQAAQAVRDANTAADIAEIKVAVEDGKRSRDTLLESMMALIRQQVDINVAQERDIADLKARGRGGSP